MSTEESTLEQGGGEALPTNQPRNDAEAAIKDAGQQDDAGKAKEAEEQKAKDEEVKRKNRTSQFIDRLKGEADSARRENAELRKRMEALESRFPKEEAKAPTLEDVGFDHQELARQTAKYEVQKARQEWEQQQANEATARTEQEKVQAYGARAQAFARENPDFEEVVHSIPQQFLTPELQRAIMAHEKGPEIAYQLAQNDDELFRVASTRPELMEMAVARFAARLDAAPPTGEQGSPAASALAPPQTQKPVSQAPAPAPRVGGRSPTDTPPEKLTDDQWWAKRQEARRKR